MQRYGDLRDTIVPFFHGHPLRTSKRDNFETFARTVDLMGQGRHLSVPGIVEIAEIAQTMNFRKPSEVLRILRDHTPAPFPVSREEDEMVRTPWRHGEAAGNGQPASRGVVPSGGHTSNRSSEIPCRVSSDLHEWRNDFPTVSTTDPAKLNYE